MMCIRSTSQRVRKIASYHLLRAPTLNCCKTVWEKLVLWCFGAQERSFGHPWKIRIGDSQLSQFSISRWSANKSKKKPRTRVSQTQVSCIPPTQFLHFYTTCFVQYFTLFLKEHAFVSPRFLLKGNFMSWLHK